MTTAKFAVIENPRIYQFVGRWTDYTERFAYAKVFEVTRDFIQDVSWMTKEHSYVIHFCHNGIEDICDGTPDIKTDGKSLLFVYDVFMMTRDEKSYTTEELIRYANHHYDYRYTPENIYGFGFDDVTVDDIDNGLKMAEPIAKMNIDRKVIYEDELADYQNVSKKTTDAKSVSSRKHNVNAKHVERLSARNANTQNVNTKSARNVNEQNARNAHVGNVNADNANKKNENNVSVRSES